MTLWAEHFCFGKSVSPDKHIHFVKSNKNYQPANMPAWIGKSFFSFSLSLFFFSHSIRQVEQPNPNNATFIILNLNIWQRYSEHTSIEWNQIHSLCSCVCLYLRFRRLFYIRVYFCLVVNFIKFSYAHSHNKCNILETNKNCQFSMSFDFQRMLLYLLKLPFSLLFSCHTLYIFTQRKWYWNETAKYIHNFRICTRTTV